MGRKAEALCDVLKEDVEYVCGYWRTFLTSLTLLNVVGMAIAACNLWLFMVRGKMHGGSAMFIAISHAPTGLALFAHFSPIVELNREFQEMHMPITCESARDLLAKQSGPGRPRTH